MNCVDERLLTEFKKSEDDGSRFLKGQMKVGQKRTIDTESPEQNLI